MSIHARTNAYRSSDSVIVSGPGTMYNEVTRPKSNSRQYHANTNTHDVTVPPSGLPTKLVQYIKPPKSKPTKTQKRKSKDRKNKNK